ncbi:PREDICTED: putative glucosylceramidase 3 [Rhagoletis zephyria]|uniref:putative glucosylceramidase 3 n=1 Tax=Rhagoletis zephyria TaxID=28612 RepID=UPI0008117E28|nr:PREDICTED: putative glucosylceramidase 3 [Rhagoletis zephyria]
MWGLTIENEPQMGYRSDYRFNSLGFNSTMEREFVKHNLGPELERTGHKDIKVMIYDDNIVTSQGNIEEFANTVLSDKDANKYVAGVAYHWYAQHADKKMLDRIAKKYTNKFLLSTEACEEWHGKKNHVMLGHWATFDRYADDIIKDLQHSSSGFVDWNLVLDLNGGPNWVSNFVDAPIIVNATAGEYYRQPFFYALGHFSKFLVPNSVRLENDGTSDAGDSVQVVIFQRPDKSTVLTVLNKNNHPIMLKLHDPLQGFLVTDVMANSLESLIWY